MKENEQATGSTPLEVVQTFGQAAAVAVPSDVKALRKAAQDFRNCVEKAQKKYWELCVLIRDRQIAPDVVTKELVEVGFRPERIAEVKRVCFASVPVFEDFRAGKIGFRFALQRARTEATDDAAVQEELPGVTQRNESPEQRFKRELREFLELHVPVSGTLPKMFSYAVKGTANGHAFTLTVSKKKSVAS